MISFKNKGFSLGLTELLAHLLPAGPFTYGPDSFVFFEVLLVRMVEQAGAHSAGVGERWEEMDAFVNEFQD